MPRGVNGEWLIVNGEHLFVLATVCFSIVTVDESSLQTRTRWGQPDGDFDRVESEIGRFGLRAA